jgi:hypothetical protein
MAMRDAWDDAEAWAVAACQGWGWVVPAGLNAEPAADGWRGARLPGAGTDCAAVSVGWGGLPGFGGGRRDAAGPAGGAAAALPSR